MIEDAAGTPNPEDGQPAGTPGDPGAPAATAQPKPAPEWLDAATRLLGRDPHTGLIDTDRLLQILSWQSRVLFSHAKTDRAHHAKAGLLEQIEAIQATSVPSSPGPPDVPVPTDGWNDGH